MRGVPARPHRIERLLVDLDDTLFDHIGSSDRALRRLRARHDVLQQWSPRELLRRHSAHLEAIHPMVLDNRLSIDEARTERMRRLFRDAGVPLTTPEAFRRARELRGHYQALRRAVPGAAAFLRYAHRRARISVVTNNLLDEQREKLEFLRLTTVVDDLVTSEEVGVAKPDPGIFRAALDRSGADPGATLVVGDSYAADIEGAIRVGLPVVWFNRFGARPPAGRPAVPELHRWSPPSAAWTVLERGWRAGALPTTPTR